MLNVYSIHQNQPDYDIFLAGCVSPLLLNFTGLGVSKHVMLSLFWQGVKPSQPTLQSLQYFAILMTG